MGISGFAINGIYLSNMENKENTLCKRSSNHECKVRLKHVIELFPWMELAYHSWEMVV